MSEPGKLLAGGSKYPPVNEFVKNHETSQFINNQETCSLIQNHETSLCEPILQVDGNISLLDTSLEIQAGAGQSIPVHLSEHRNQTPNLQPRRQPILKTIRRNNAILQSMELPVIMNINPRSIYNKTEEFLELLEQYSPQVITISESWERENLSLEELLKLENYKIITNVKQRDFKGGKPAIIINEEKFYVKTLCPDPVTVPVGWSVFWP